MSIPGCKYLISFVLLAAIAPATADASPGDRGAKIRGRAGAQVMILPAGSIELEGFGLGGSTDAALAYGLSMYAEGTIGSYLTLGLHPQMIFNVRDDDADDATEELDLMARVTGRYPTKGSLAPYVYLAPGYSIIFPFTDEGESAQGFVLGFGAGAEMTLFGNAYASVEVGFQFGWQGTEIAGQDVSFETEYLHMGFGMGTRF